MGTYQGKKKPETRINTGLRPDQGVKVRVKGQAIDATQAGVVFVNGTAANLAKSVPVSVIGNQVVNGVLIATQVTF